MKNLVQLTIAATLAIGVTANSHQHLHRHVKKDTGSKVEKRAPDGVVWVAGPTKTVYQLDGTILPADKAEAGLKNGELVAIGETTPTYTPPPPPKPTSTKVQKLGAQFIEQSSAPPPPKSTAPPPPKNSPAPKPSPPSGGTGLDAKFPSGKVKCTDFPSEYGAVALDYLQLGGYSGIQNVPGFSLKVSLSISTIHTGVAGDKCKSGGMCSYSCPPGYQKTQWSSAQGATGQSIGGLYCNDEGYLELTRPTVPYLCEKGAGGVYVKNDLKTVVSTCRTDYPGTESMVIPTELQAGQTLPLTNPDSATYYKWDGKDTTAQYYVNKRGVAAQDCCVWNCLKDPKACGNWAPINIGVGKSASGITYLSIFPNAPTSIAKLDFNIEIIGDVSIKCAYVNGQFVGGSSNGCTTGMQPGGKAVIRYY